MMVRINKEAFLNVLKTARWNPKFSRESANDYIIKGFEIMCRNEPRGKWIDIGKNYYTVVSQCSECGAKYDFRSPYCPNCGMKMDGDPE